MDIREEFEELPEIARMVTCEEIKWCDVYKWYRTDNTDANSIYHVAWLNGAWYAYQEQQKKIDAIIKWVEENKKSIPLSEWHGYTTEEYVDADDLLELLK